MKKLLILGLLVATPGAFASPLLVQGGASGASVSASDYALEAGIDGNKDRFDEEFDDNFVDDNDDAQRGRYNTTSHVGGFVQGGVGGAIDYLIHDVDDSYEQTGAGVGFNVEGGVRFAPGFEVKLSYNRTSHNGTDLYDSDDYLIDTSDGDVTFDDLRAAFYYAPPPRSIFGFRVGAGYVRQGTSYESNDDAIVTFVRQGTSYESDDGAFVTDGFFVEGGVSLDLGRYVTLNANGAYLKMTDDYDADLNGGEFKAGALFHTGPIDIGLSWRFQGLSYDAEDYPGYKELYYDYRLTVGGSWGYGSRRRR